MKKKTAPCAESEGPWPCDHGMAIQDINRAHELISQLHALLLHLLPVAGGWSQVGGDIFKEILKLTSSALSRLQSTGFGSSGGYDGRNTCAGDKRKSSERGDRPGGSRKRRRKHETWSIITTAPCHDGHQWRKYGQKTINHAKYQRSYYRCTYRNDQLCLAQKTIQQEDSYADPPKFIVEYCAEHTCKPIDTIFPFVMESAPKEALLSSGSSDMKFQDQQHLSPPPVAASNQTHDGSLSMMIGDRAQERQLPRPELLRPAMPVDMLGQMDMALNILSPTGPWDYSDFSMGDDGWYNAQY